MASRKNWEKMNMEERIKAAHIDIMRHPEFALLSGVLCMGRVVFEDTLPTAGTDGLDVYYGRAFMSKQSMEQVRWVVLHENFHKAFKHCTIYSDLIKKYGRLPNIAQDFLINLMIYDMDPGEGFARRPAGIEICFDEKYRGMSFIEILRELLKQAQQQGGGGGEGAGGGGVGYATFDEHRPGKEMTPAEAKKISDQIDQALAHGRIIVSKTAGNGKGGSAIDRIMHERRTDWREPLRQFISSIVQGDDYSRFCPPNKRMLPLGFVMPSHFSMSTGELIVACDTSGSMGPVYPVVFGEIARIALTARPDIIRILWWDTQVYEPQVFKPHEYEQIGKLMKPEGGGGTHPQCVVDYIAAHKLKPKAVVWLTDGYLDGSNTGVNLPQIWGVVDNEQFVPPQGKVVRISSLNA